MVPTSAGAPRPAAGGTSRAWSAIRGRGRARPALAARAVVVVGGGERARAPRSGRRRNRSPSGQESCHSSPRRIGTAAPPASTPSTSTSGPPIMKSVWIVETLKPSSSSSASLFVSPPAIASRMPGSVGDVAARVLVEERVQEVSPERPTRESPSTSATSPSSDAFSSCADLLADQVRAGARVHLHAAAALEPHLEIAHDVARERERLRRADSALGAAPIGARENLLGRHVDDVPAPVDGLLERRAPGRARDQPDGEVGAGPAEADRVERALVEQRRALDELVDVRAPGLDRIGLVEPRRRGDGVPEPLHVRLAENGLRPALVRVGDDRPVDQTLVRRLHVALCELLRIRVLPTRAPSRSASSSGSGSPTIWISAPCDSAR